MFFQTMSLILLFLIFLQLSLRDEKSRDKIKNLEWRLENLEKKFETIFYQVTRLDNLTNGLYIKNNRNKKNQG